MERNQKKVAEKAKKSILKSRSVFDIARSHLDSKQLQSDTGKNDVKYLSNI